jgi:DNA-binding MarR family transcriptional regulator
LIRKTASPQDGRLYIIVPTEKGKKEFSKLNESSNILISQMIARLSRKERSELVGMMEGIRELLDRDHSA